MPPLIDAADKMTVCRQILMIRDRFSKPYLALMLFSG